MKSQRKIVFQTFGLTNKQKAPSVLRIPKGLPVCQGLVFAGPEAPHGAPGFCVVLVFSGLALSGADAPALPKGEPRACRDVPASPLGRGVTAGDGEGEPAGKTSQSPPATAPLVGEPRARLRFRETASKRCRQLASPIRGGGIAPAMTERFTPSFSLRPASAGRSTCSSFWCR